MLVWECGNQRIETRYGNMGTRVWEPTYWNGNMGTTVWERGYWNMGMVMGGSQLSMGIWEPWYGNHTNLAKHILEGNSVPPTHVLLHGLGVFLLCQFETLQFHFQFRELLLISGLHVLAAHPSSLVGPLGGCRCEGVWGRGGEGDMGRWGGRGK